jgi:hypothetical protein
MPEMIAHGRFGLLQGLAMALGFITALAIFPTLGFASVFSVAALYDDEGCMLISLKQFIDGHALYDDVFSMYGPFPFLLKWALYSVLHQAVGHDLGRLICLGFWVATTAACAGVAWRLTRSLFAGFLGFVFCFQALWLIVYEPGHPQEIAGLLLAISVLTVAFAHPSSQRSMRLLAAILGCLAGCLAMTKINVFVFMMMALGEVVLASTPALEGRPGRWITLVFGLGILAAPSVLMQARLGNPSVAAFDLYVTLALGGVLLAGSRKPASSFFGARHYLAFASALVMTMGVVAGVVFARGSTLPALVDGIVLNPIRVGTRFGSTPPWFRTSWPMPMVIDMAVLGSIVLARLWPDSKSRVAGFLNVCRTGFAALVLICATKVRFEVHSILLLYAMPGAALLLVPASASEHSAGAALGRRFLAFLAVTTSMWAYPVAGSQRAFASFLSTLMLVVILVDGTREIAGAWGPVHAARLRLAGHLVQAAVFLSLMFIYLSEAVIARSVYEARLPLALPGARLIRLDRETVTRYQRLVAALKEQPDTFFTMPGMYSLYFFTGREPPTTLNLTNWMYIFDDQTQARIVAELESRPRVCVVFNDGLIEYWMQGRPLPTSPLVRYIEANFVTATRIYDDEIRVHRPVLTRADPL